MAGEGLSRTTAADIPELGSGVASTGDKYVLAGAKGQTTEIDEYESEIKGPREKYLMTSPVWSLNSTTRTPASMSQSMQVISPEEVTI